MKWIGDEDEASIRQARRAVSRLARLPEARRAHELLGEVLDNMAQLGREQINPAPRCVELSEAEMRVFYPERF